MAEPPQAADDSFSTNEDAPVVINLPGNDREPDAQPLTVTEVAGQPIAPGGSVTITDPLTGATQGTVTLAPNGDLSFTPAPGFNGTVSFPYTVGDPTGATASSPATITEGRLPQAANEAVANEANAELGFDIGDTIAIGTTSGKSRYSA